MLSESANNVEAIKEIGGLANLFKKLIHTLNERIRTYIYNMASSKCPILTFFLKITLIDLFLTLLLALWIPPDSGAELGFLIVMMAMFGIYAIVSTVFFFMHKEIIWKAWLMLAFASPFYFILVNKIWMIIKY